MNRCSVGRKRGALSVPTSKNFLTCLLTVGEVGIILDIVLRLIPFVFTNQTSLVSHPMKSEQHGRPLRYRPSDLRPLLGDVIQTRVVFRTPGEMSPRATQDPPNSCPSYELKHSWPLWEPCHPLSVVPQFTPLVQTVV